MRDKELQLILDRGKHELDAKQHFSKHIDLLVDLVNYGTNLVRRAYDSSNKKLEDVIVIGVLLKHVISMIDAVEVLISKGAVSAAHLPARAAFEASLYIDWILKGESEKKAKYYYVSNLRHQRLWALRLKTGTLEKETFSEALKHIEKYIKTADIEALAKQADGEFNKIDALLSNPGWNEISDEFEKKKNKKTNAECDWYRLLGVSSIRQLAKGVGRLGEYEIFYSRCSEVMHGASYRDHVQFAKGRVTFEPIRQLKDINPVLRLISLAAISSYKSILEVYRYEELTHFARKYQEEWRDAFLNIPSVSYTSQVHVFGPHNPNGGL